MGRRGRQEGASCPLLHTAVYCYCVPFGAAQQAPGGILPGTDPINTTDFRTDVRLPAATTQLLKI